MVRPAHYAIIAATLHGNRGAQAMAETVIGTVGDADASARFEFFSYYPSEDRARLSDPRVRVHSSTPAALVLWLLPWSILFGLLRLLAGDRVLSVAPRAIRALGRSRVLVDLAGVAFIDGREKFLPFNVLTLLPAWLLGTPVVKMPQATGPFRNAFNRACARLVLPRCHAVWARGARTYAHLQESGLAALRFSQADDIAFNYEPRWSLTTEHEDKLQPVLARIRELRHAGIRGVIGVCPSSVVAVQSTKAGTGYEAALVDVVCALLRSGLGVVLFPNATRDEAGDAQRNNDLPLIRRVATAISKSESEHLVAVDFDINAAGIKAVIGAMDVVLVSRFHAMVGALSLGVPPAVLGWSHKYAEVMARFGLEDRVLDYKTAAPADLHATVEMVFGERESLRARILQALPAVKASAARPVQALLTDHLGRDDVG